MSSLKVRFAPSPTGPFHIGGARSALFNWLLAKNKEGTFLIRIEDTDSSRSTLESEENIKKALTWLGMDWNEGIDVGGPNGPYRQSERLSIYQEITDQLLAEDKAYYCYCSPEKLEAEKQAQLDRGETPRYTGHCSHLTEEECEAYKKEGRKPVVRLRVPKGQTYTFDDMVRGTISFDSDGVGDYVIVKSDGVPVYNYCVALDDHLMGVTHVIRAEEHISNTPRQLAVYEALSWTPPVFGHISLILGKDYKKMSKRHGATSVDQYRQLGYLPEALVNFLALLGWSPKGEQEIFSLDELIKEFSMDHVAKNPAVFDIDKLNHINFTYMKKLSTYELYQLCLPHLQGAGYASPMPQGEEKEKLELLCETLRDHISFGAQIVEEASFLFAPSKSLDGENEEVRAVIEEETFPLVMQTFISAFEKTESLTPEDAKQIIKKVMKETKLKGKFIYMPVRVALTGKAHGPELPNMLSLFGKEEAIKRLTTALNMA